MRSPLKCKSLVMVVSALLGLGLLTPTAAAAGTTTGGARPAGNSACC